MRRRRTWPWVLGGLAVAVTAALGFAFLAWPRGSLHLDPKALARVQEPTFGGRAVLVSVRNAAGAALPVTSRDGRLWPVRPVSPGTTLSVEVVVRRPGWIAWAAGRTEHLRLDVTAPLARIERRWLRIRAGDPVRVTFDRPVQRVALTGAGKTASRLLPRPSQTVALGRLGRAGSIGVRAAATSWELLAPPTNVTWFPRGAGSQLLVSPRPGSVLGASTPLRLRFSEPLATLLHGRLPRLSPAVPGRWRAVGGHTLVFEPHGYGFGLDAHVRLRLPVPVQRVGGAARPTRLLGWTTPPGSELRLQQLLAELGYLPLRWTSTTTDAARTLRAQLAAAVHPPAGSFSWRYPNTPPELRALWRPGQTSQIVRGAVMMFQDDHGLAVDAFPGTDVWRALIADVLAGKGRTDGYSYVYVHRSVPQSLNLWHNGSTILSSPGNTGVPAAPTQLGTFPVFEHIPVGTMSGTNPDGSHYNDPGIRYISYFNHGDAIHAFNRASFGTPQSLGCVELPLASAARVWPYTPIGTLVTVED